MKVIINKYADPLYDSLGILLRILCILELDRARLASEFFPRMLPGMPICAFTYEEGGRTRSTITAMVDKRYVHATPRSIYVNTSRNARTVRWSTQSKGEENEDEAVAGRREIKKERANKQEKMRELGETYGQ